MQFYLWTSDYELCTNSFLHNVQWPVCGVLETNIDLINWAGLFAFENRSFFGKHLYVIFLLFTVIWDLHIFGWIYEGTDIIGSVISL